MALNGKEFGQFQSALLSGYTSRSALAQMVRIELDVNLDSVAGGSNLTDIVGALITWAEENNRTADLLRGARAQREGNVALREFEQSLHNAAKSVVQTPAPVTQPTTAASVPVTTSAPPTNTPVAPRAIEIFYSYSHRDEALKDKLVVHLAGLRRKGIITEWHDRMIAAGTEWKGQIDAHLDSAHVILLLVSPDFLASNYCWDVEVKRALERHEKREAHVIPVILRHTADWTDAPFGKLQALPRDGKPVRSWSDEDEAFVDVAQGIRKVVESLLAQK